MCFSVASCGWKIYRSPKSWSNLGCRNGGILIPQLLPSWSFSRVLSVFQDPEVSWLEQTRSADAPGKSPGKRPKLLQPVCCSAKWRNRNTPGFSSELSPLLTNLLSAVYPRPGRKSKSPVPLQWLSGKPSATKMEEFSRFSKRPLTRCMSQHFFGCKFIGGYFNHTFNIVINHL